MKIACFLLLVLFLAQTNSPAAPAVVAPGNILFTNTAPDLPPPLAVTTPLPPTPPAPPPVTWEVRGFRWDGIQWVKDPTRCLQTTDLNQALAYAREVFTTSGWQERNNLPALCSPILHVDDPFVPTGCGSAPADAPPNPIYTVLAYKLVDGKWVQDLAYSRASDNRLLGLDYAQRLATVAGWCATTNCPPSTYAPGMCRDLYLGVARGAEGCGNYYYHSYYHHHHHHH